MVKKLSEFDMFKETKIEYSKDRKEKDAMHENREKQNAGSTLFG